MLDRAVRATLPRMEALRDYLATIKEGEGKGASKKARNDALKSITRDLSNPSVVAGLNYFTRRESVLGELACLCEDEGGGGGGADDFRPSWTELIAELLDVLHIQASAEGKKARPVLLYVLHVASVLRTAVGIVLREGLADALTVVMPNFFARLITWHAGAPLAELLPDAWAILADCLALPSLRATLIPNVVQALTEMCFSHLAERGALFHPAVAAALSSVVKRVFVLLATEAPAYVALGMRGKNKTSKKLLGTFAYSTVMQRACDLLMLARGMEAGKQRDVEATALAVLAAAASSHALDLDGAVAVQKLKQYGAPAAAACWGERRHRDSALQFVCVLVRLVDVEAGGSQDVDLLREKVEEDLAAYASGGGLREKPEAELLEIASVMYDVADILEGLRRCIRNAEGSTMWLRILHARLLRREHSSAAALLDVVGAVVGVFKKVGGDSRALPATCALWACRVTRVAAQMAACLPSAMSGGYGLMGSSGGDEMVGVGGSTAAVGGEVECGGGFGTVPHLASHSKACEADDQGVSAVRGASSEDGMDLDTKDVPAIMVVTREPSRFVWLSVYKCLVQQLLRGRMTTMGRGRHGGRRSFGGHFARAEMAVIDLASFLVSVGAVSTVDVSAVLAVGAGAGGDTVWNLSLFDAASSSSSTSCLFEFVRTHVSVTGFDIEDAGAQKMKVLRKLLTVCDPAASQNTKLSGGSILNASSAALGLIRGSCRQLSTSLGSESLPDERSDALGDVEDIRPRCVKLLDALRAIFCFPDQVEGEAAVLQASYFRSVQSGLEADLFPAGGGWNDMFILGDRAGAVTPEKVMRMRARPTRMAVDKGLVRRLEDEVVAILSSCCRSAEKSGAFPSRESKPVRSSSTGQRHRGQSSMKGNIDSDAGDGDKETAGEESDDEEDDLPEADDFDDFLNSNLLDGSGSAAKDDNISALPSAQCVEVYLRVVIFLGEYLAESINLGLHTMAAEQEEQGGDASELKMANIMAMAVKRLAESPVDLFVRKSTLEILPHAVVSSMSIADAIASRDRGASTARGRIMRKLGQSVRENVMKGLANVLFKRLCTAINRFSLGYVATAKSFILSMNRLLKNGRSGSMKRKRSSTSSTKQASPRSRKRSKRSPDKFDDDDESDGSAFVDSDDGFMSERGDDSDDGGNVGDVDGAARGSREMEDAWNDNGRESQPGTQQTQTPSSSGGAASEEDIILSLCRCLLPVFSVVPDAVEKGPEKLVEALNAVRITEKNMNPDGELHSCVASEHICPSYVAVRCAVWDLLFAAGSSDGIEGAAADMVRVGEEWLGLVHSLTQVSKDAVDEYGYSKRSRIVLSPYLENFRTLLLRNYSRFVEYCLGVGARCRSQPAAAKKTKRGARVRSILASVGELRKFEDSKTPAPRETKIVLIRFSASALELVEGPFSEDRKATEHCEQLRHFLQAALTDSDPAVRLAVAGVGPILLRVPGETDKKKGQSDPEFPSLPIPERKVCSDMSKNSLTSYDESEVCVADSDEEMDGNPDARAGGTATVEVDGCGYESSWLLSSSSKKKAKGICDAFMHVGANGMGNIAFVALSETGSRCAPERETAIYAILSRTRTEKLCGSQSVAFGALVRLASRVGYRDPAGMFRAYRREILSRWSAEKNDFFGLPPCLLLPGDRFRTGGIYDLLSDHNDEIVPLVLASDSSADLSNASAFATEYGCELCKLLTDNWLAIFRLFVTCNERDSKLFGRIIDKSSAGGQPITVFQRSHGPEILCSMLLSISGGSVSRVTRENFNVGRKNIEFIRNCHHINPPQYDPLVCLRSMEIYATGSGNRHTIDFLAPGDITGESLFKAGREAKKVETTKLRKFITDRPYVAAQLLAGIMQQLEGPPGPSSAQSRCNAFMALGSLYFVAGFVLREEAVLRFALFDLILCGFRHRETARNAQWLLQDVCDWFTKENKENDQAADDDRDYEFLPMWDSSSFGSLRLPQNHFLRKVLQFGSPGEQYLFEILELATPSLISIGGCAIEDTLVEVARRMVRNLFGIAKDGVCVAVLDALPEGKTFKAERLQQENAFQELQEKHLQSPERLLEYHFWRFACRRKVAVLEPSGLVAPLKSLRKALEKNRPTLERVLKSKTRLDGDEMSSANCVFSFASHALRSLLAIVEKCRRDRSGHSRNGYAGPVHLDFMDQNLVQSKRNHHERDAFAVVEEEALRCIGVLGTSWPANLPLEGFGEVQVSVETSVSSRASPAVQAAGSLLFVEIRSENAVARQIACLTLSRFFQTIPGYEVYKQQQVGSDEFALFATGKVRKKGMKSPEMLDPLSGSKVENKLLDMRTASVWNPCHGRTDSSSSSYEAPSAWVRTLSAVLTQHCDDAALKVLDASCFASSAFASSMFPHLLCHVVRSIQRDSIVISAISQLILSEILENQDAPIGALRLLIAGLDALCEIGLDEVRSVRGVGKAFYVPPSGRDKRRTERPSELYVLTIPYLTAARAANKCGAYFSALRFASLYVDSACIKAERQFILEKSDGSATLTALLSKTSEEARGFVGDVISVASKHISELDGQRAIVQGGGVIAQSAVVASVESNWPRLLGSCDVLQGLNAARGGGPESGPRSSSKYSPQSFSLVRERDIVRSMIGLGSLNGVVKYWHGLRHETVGFALCSNAAENMSRNGSGFGSLEEELEAASDLFELRCEAAWKLEQWQTPAALHIGYLSSREQSTTSAAGLHESLHSGLRSLSSGDVSGALSSVVNAREAIAGRLTYGLSGSTLASVREAAQSLVLVEDVYLAASVLAEGQNESLSNAARSSLVSSSTIISTEASRFVDGSDVSRAGARFKEMRSGLVRPARILPESNESGGVMNERTNNELRFMELNDIWRERDSSTVYSVQRSFVSPGYVEMARSLRLALARALGVRPYVTRMCGELAASILDGARETGSWSRAASALGAVESLGVINAGAHVIGTWRLAESRLCWEASEDGSTKLRALQAVRCLIFDELGGQQNSSDSGDGSEAKWNLISGVEENSHSLALLRAEACHLAAMWSSEMRVAEPMTLFHGLLKMGLNAFSSADDSGGKCNAYYTMAQFADRQLTSIETYRKTKEYAFKVQSVRKMEETIEKSGVLMGSIPRADTAKRNGLARYLRDIELNCSRDSEALERVSASVRDWQFHAARHYAKCLEFGSANDLRAAFRLVYFWLESGTAYPTINQFLASAREDGSLKCHFPTSKLLPLAPQIASRLGATGNHEYQRTLDTIFTKMTSEHPTHCLWLLIALSNLTKKASKTTKAQEALNVGNQVKKQKADSIIAVVKKVDRKSKETVEQTLLLTNFYFQVSEIPHPDKKEKFEKKFPRLPKAVDLDRVVIPTIPLPLHGFSAASGKLPTVARFEEKGKVLGGVSTPILLRCIGTDGVSRPQVVKYGDDMRQDAVMEQLFGVLNELLDSSEASSVRNLRIRTYRVVPLSPRAGIMQFLCNTEPVRSYLTGDPGCESTSAHSRHRPHDLTHSAVSVKAGDLCKANPTNLAPRFKHMRKVWDEFHPVFRYYFLEKFSNPEEWHARQLAYTRSVAVMAIAGYYLGLGDRHLSNILIDSKTAELIHIDFGVAFGAGKLLKTPELMPFRLSRDIVDGMGIDGVEGVFRKSCEVTMQLLRDNKDLVLMVVDVLLHDPLYNWSRPPLKALQRDDSSSDLIVLDGVESEDQSGGKGQAGGRSSKEDGNEKAMHVLSVISEKLEGLESTDRLPVEAHVARLIDEARSFNVLACAYPGWAPWL